MDNPIDNPLTEVNSGLLTPMVRSALDCTDAEVLEWKSEILHGANDFTATYRFTGIARSQQSTLPWSLILKTARSAEGGDDPASAEYWKREACAYQSGLLTNLPAGLSAPGCYGVVEKSGPSAWVWLEEVKDEIGSPWSLEDYGFLAHRLGLFNGAYLEERSLPDYPWLARSWLRAWTGNSAQLLPIQDGVLNHPLVASVFSKEYHQRMLQFWSENELWLDIIEHEPQTLAHQDAFRRNILTRHASDGELRINLIDWAFLGYAALGEEIAPLVTASLNFLEVDAAQARALDRIVFERYLEGLEDAGWHGEAHRVRFVYAAASFLRYAVAGVAPVLYMLADEKLLPMVEMAFGHPVKDLLEVWRQTISFLYDLGNEAHDLATQLRPAPA